MPDTLTQALEGMPCSHAEEVCVRSHCRLAERPSWSKDLVLLVAIMLIGTLVRLLLWSGFRELPLHIWDEKDYNILARNLLEHGEFAFTPGRPTSLRPPLYPALLAGMYQLFGIENFQAVRFLQAGLSLATVVLLYLLGRDLLDRRTGLLLAGLYCFYPSMLGYNNLLLTEVLFTFFFVAVCYTLVRSLRNESIGWHVATGILLGLACLTRSVLWLFPPVLALFLLFAWKVRWQRRLLGVAVLLLSFAATIGPWSLRNTRLEQTFVAVDTMGGRNFMMGNYRYTPLYRAWDAIDLKGEKYWYNELLATDAPGESLTQGQVDKLALRHGLRFAWENPGLTLKRDIIKFFDFWGVERELVSGAARGYFGALSRPMFLAMTALIFGSYVTAVFLAIFGMLLAPPADRRVHWLFLLIIAFVCGMHTLTFGHSRYHLPVMPLVLLYSACALVNARGIWQQRHHWTFWLAGGLCGLLVGGWVVGVAAGDLRYFLNALGAVV